MQVKFYSTHCPKCIILEKKLQEKGIQYEEENDVDVMQEKGFLSAPILEVDGETMEFGSAVKWINDYSGDDMPVEDFHCDTCGL